MGSLGQPIVFLLALGFGFGATFAKAGSGNYFNFVTPGIVAMGILFTAVFSGIEIIWDRQFGFLKETLVAPVSRLEIVLGRVLGGAIVAMIQGAVVFLVCLALGFRFESWLQLPVAVVFMFLISLLFTSIGDRDWLRAARYAGLPAGYEFPGDAAFFLSDALFPLKGLPRILTFALRLNPLTYGIDGLRGALGHAYAFNVFTDFAVLCVASFILLSIGSYLFSKIQL